MRFSWILMMVLPGLASAGIITSAYCGGAVPAGPFTDVGYDSAHSDASCDVGSAGATGTLTISAPDYWQFNLTISGSASGPNLGGVHSDLYAYVPVVVYDTPPGSTLRAVFLVTSLGSTGDSQGVIWSVSPNIQGSGEHFLAFTPGVPVVLEVDLFGGAGFGDVVRPGSYSGSFVLTVGPVIGPDGRRVPDARVSVIPEPGTWSLVLVGLMGMMAFGARRAAGGRQKG